MVSLSRAFLSLVPVLLAIVNGLAWAGESALVTVTGAAPVKYESQTQPVTIYACNDTTVHHKISWNGKNRVSVPYGQRIEDGKRFFISKYYVASPPLPNSFAADEPLILGVLSEDHFVMAKPEQNVDVFMNYTLLKPIELGFLSVDYAGVDNDNDLANCVDQGVNFVPINIRCPSFEYTDGKAAGLGKGIAQLARKSDDGGLTDKGQLFIPLNLDTKLPLEGCTVEILNDIILDHQVYFGTSQEHAQTLDLTYAYKAFLNGQEPVRLYCKTRPENEPAEGCQPVVLE